MPHRRLISNLYNYGVNEKVIMWVSAFLSNRSQQVVINETKSKLVKMLSHIPQGSVLGPLLFIIFINRIVSNRY